MEYDTSMSVSFSQVMDICKAAFTTALRDGEQALF
jgi:hypothetical protein